MTATASKLARLASKFHAVCSEWAVASAERPAVQVDHDSFAVRFRDAKAKLAEAIVASTPADALPPSDGLDDLTPVGIAVIDGDRYEVVTDMNSGQGHHRLVITPATA